jgi:hypothetical protein
MHCSNLKVRAGAGGCSGAATAAAAAATLEQQLPIAAVHVMH